MDAGPIDSILRRLDSQDPASAWAEFLDEYTPPILQVIRHFEREADCVSDCYLFVCEHLRRNRFRRLARYRMGGPTPFSTYLRAVVRNLCIDWHRKQVGRHRVFESVEKGCPLDGEVFRIVLEGGASAEEAFLLLAPRIPRLNRAQVANSVERIQRGLTERQRWLLAVRHAARSLPSPLEEAGNGPVHAVEDGSLDPETLTAQRETQERLEKAIRALPAKARLLLQFRYEQELTLEQVARLAGLENAQQADRKIREIVAELRKQLL